ncbi:MAG: hypothetical protein SGJ00_11595 [bacterium]|nr:hypothetical protein [bacterium]
MKSETLNKFFAILSIAVLISFSACLKMPELPPKEDTQSNKKFADLVTSPSFNWGTTKKVTVNVFGLINQNISGTLKLSEKVSGAIHYMGSHLMSETISLKLEIPTSQDSIKLTFGSISKMYVISGSTINMDYIIDYPEN